MPQAVLSCPAFLVALALASPAVAEEFLSDPYNFPQRFAVTDVAAGDALNIRAAPSSDAPILETLAPDATGVEVIDVSDDGAWALIPLREGMGWASTRYLAAEDLEAGLTEIPFPLRCVGTEPFWGVDLHADGATYDMSDEGKRDLRPIGQALTYDGFVLAYDDNGQTRDFTVLRRECTDGMSDRAYGFAVINWNRGDEVWSGCCHFLPQ
jgi:uncharacterized membrane protein